MSEGQTAAFVVRDGRKSRYGVIYLGHIDTEAFRGLDPCARLTYFALLPFVGANSQKCWPKIKKLAAITGYHIVSVKKAIKALTEAGYIEVGKLEFSKARRVNLYTLLEPPA